MITTLYSLVTMFFPTIAFAQQGNCQFVGIDCSSDPGVTMARFIEYAALTLVEIVAGLAMLFVVLGGAYMVMNFGNETQIEKGKKSVYFALGGFTLAILSQAIISFVVARTDGIGPDAPHLSIMNVIVSSMLGVFNGVFALMMLYYGFKLVLARGQSSELDAVKKGVFWTVSGAVVINLSYALIQATLNLIL